MTVHIHSLNLIPLPQLVAQEIVELNYTIVVPEGMTLNLTVVMNTLCSSASTECSSTSLTVTDLNINVNVTQAIPQINLTLYVYE